jgi:hypothetical protein
MNTFVYKANDPQSHKQLGKELGKLESGEWIISWKINRPIRSISQNKFFHAVCKVYAIYTGHTLEEIKDEFKRDCFFEMKVDKQGVEFKRLKSTAKLDSAQFTHLCNALLQWGLDKHAECYVPRKEDMTYQTLMEIDERYEREIELAA